MSASRLLSNIYAETVGSRGWKPHGSLRTPLTLPCWCLGGMCLTAGTWPWSPSHRRTLQTLPQGLSLQACAEPCRSPAGYLGQWRTLWVQKSGGFGGYEVFLQTSCRLCSEFSRTKQRGWPGSADSAANTNGPTTALWRVRAPGGKIAPKKDSLLPFPPAAG